MCSVLLHLDYISSKYMVIYILYIYLYRRAGRLLRSPRTNLTSGVKNKPEIGCPLWSLLHLMYGETLDF